MAKTNFDAWLEQADMPEKRGDDWVDLEDGLPYNPNFDYIRNQPRTFTLSTKALNARDAAKAFGGRALTGSPKQKEWAEKIRAEKIAGMTADQAAQACDPDSLLRTAKFWIENRNATGAAIGEFATEYKALLARAKALKAAGKADEYAAAAATYNALTSRWGF